MKTGTKEIGVLLAVVLVGVIGTVHIHERVTVPRWSCGHLNENSIFNWLSRPHHHCLGGRLRTDLIRIQLAQGMFQTDFNRTATNLTELLPYAMGLLPKDYTLLYKSEGSQWSVSVDRNGELPGYYLLLNNKLYFAEQQAATTNDLCISMLKVD